MKARDAVAKGFTLATMATRSRFLAAQTDPSLGSEGEEKIGLFRSE